MTDLFEAARQPARRYREALGAEGVTLLHASGRAAQQSVPHLHVVPRFEGDGLEAWPALGDVSQTPEAVAAHLPSARDASGPRNPGPASS